MFSIYRSFPLEEYIIRYYSILQTYHYGIIEFITIIYKVQDKGSKGDSDISKLGRQLLWLPLIDKPLCLIIKVCTAAKIVSFISRQTYMSSYNNVYILKLATSSNTIM